jgi:hypothetical protein
VAGEFLVKRIRVEHVSGVTIALIPLIYLAINPSFGQNQAGDIDTWFYYGLGKSFWYHWGHDFRNDYYETRLPYIIPAAIIFAALSERIASFILSYLVYGTCAFSLFYVLCRHVSKPTALLATMLLVSDLFFMRTVGWQYVDGGVLAYGSLTFAALTAAATSRHRYAFVALSGFLYTSMLIVHLGSAPLGLVFVGYSILIFDIRRSEWREFFRLLFYTLIGGIVSQIIYGALNVYLYKTNFFFEDQQIAAAKATRATPPALWLPLDTLLDIGWWLTLHIAVWFAAAVMIVARLAKLFKPNRFQSYCMWAVFVTYSTLFALDYFHISLFLGRDGLYISTYLFLSYLFIGSLLPQIKHFSTALIVGSLFLASLIVRWKLGAEIGGQLIAAAPWEVGLLLGMLITGVWLIKNRIGLAFVAVAVAVLALQITWPFRYERSIYAAREVVERIVGNTLPYFVFSDTDPIYEPVVIGLVGSFTPRAWWLVCRDFPDCLQRFVGQRTIIVPSSNSDAAEVTRMARSVVPEATLSTADRLDRPEQDFFVYSFLIPKSPLLISAPTLPSFVGSVEAGRRVATNGTNAGYLTCGPYVMLDPGRYKVTMKYESEGEAGSWDVVSIAEVLAKGSISDTRGAAAEIVVSLDLPNGAKDFQVRMFYSGHGRLAVERLSINPINPSAAQ